MRPTGALSAAATAGFSGSTLATGAGLLRLLGLRVCARALVSTRSAFLAGALGSGMGKK
jgi:hypothetical protein